MQIFSPTVRIERNKWIKKDRFSAMIGDIFPKTHYAVGFVFQQKADYQYGLMKSVFMLDVNALDGSRIEFEVWVLHMYDSLGKRPDLQRLVEAADHAAYIFIDELKQSAALHGGNPKVFQNPFTRQQIADEIAFALDDAFSNG